MKAVLTYHSIDDSGSPISTATAAYRSHVAWFESRRVRVLPLDDLIAHPDGDGDAVALVFDDAFLDVRDPVERLLGAGLAATVFVVSGHVGGTNDWGGRSQPGIPALPLLGWDDLARLAARGATIGAHTRTHPCLTTLDGRWLEEEILGCCDDIQARIGVRATHFAYPYGAVDARVAGCAGRHYRFGHTTAFGALRASDAPTRLPRLDAYYFQSPGALESFGTRAFSLRVAALRARRRLRSGLIGGWAPAHAPAGGGKRPSGSIATAERSK